MALSFEKDYRKEVKWLSEIIWSHAVFVPVSQGKLKEWSLVLYGTSVQPYSPTNEFPKVERFRYSRVEDPTDDYGAEDYAGELDIGKLRHVPGMWNDLLE